MTARRRTPSLPESAYAEIADALIAEARRRADRTERERTNAKGKRPRRRGAA